MKSLYAKVLISSITALLLSLFAFVALSRYLSRRAFEANPPFERSTLYLLDDAVRAWEHGGHTELAAMLARQERHFPAKLAFTDSRGTDLLTGADHSQTLRTAGDKPTPEMHVQANHTPDGRYYLIADIQPPPGGGIRSFLPYYVLILIPLAGLGWFLATNIASPIRKFARAVDRFGAGDLEARVDVDRQDEIGDLARAFNQMAVRMQTLLNAERRLLQDISHELRSPLTRLGFAAELSRTAQDRNAAVERMKTEIDRLADLVSGLLQVTRAEGEFTDRSLELVRLDHLVRGIATSSELEAMAAHCDIRTNIEKGLTARGDRELLRRAIENILSNALRHAPETSAIDVSLALKDSSAVIAIRDYGPGVPEDLLAKLFTPFFRVDDSRDSATGGVGLGLAIAQRAIMLHHGHISARNASPGLEVTISIAATHSPEA